MFRTVSLAIAITSPAFTEAQGVRGFESHQQCVASLSLTYVRAGNLLAQMEIGQGGMDGRASTVSPANRAGTVSAKKAVEIAVLSYIDNLSEACKSLRLSEAKSR